MAQEQNSGAVFLPTWDIEEFLAQHSYPNLKNLAGGILAWADQINPGIQKY